MSSPQRIAIVTSANRGLGLETCRQLAQQGYQVVLDVELAVFRTTIETNV
jgi:NAD(P)-dependent dehydrogenase (short-subunit alcohol dehydrogenase family)